MIEEQKENLEAQHESSRLQIMDVATQRCLRRAKPIVSDMMRYIIRKEHDAHALEGEALLEELHQSVL